MKEMESETMRLLKEQRKCLARLVAAEDARMAANPESLRVSICAVQSNPALLEGRTHNLQNNQNQ